jgi:hypothetical protein
MSAADRDELLDDDELLAELLPEHARRHAELLTRAERAGLL